MGACGRTPSCPVRLSRAPAHPRGRDRGHPGQPHTPLLLTCVVPTACPGPGVRTNVEGKAGTGLVPSPAPGPLSSPRSPLQPPLPSPAPRPLSSSWPSSGRRDAECRWQGAGHDDLERSLCHPFGLGGLPSFLPRQTERSRSHLFDKPCGLDKYLPSGSLCQERRQGTFSQQLPAGLPRFPMNQRALLGVTQRGRGALGSGVVGLQYSGMFTSARCLQEPTHCEPWVLKTENIRLAWWSSG